MPEGGLSAVEIQDFNLDGMSLWGLTLRNAEEFFSQPDFNHSGDFNEIGSFLTKGAYCLPMLTSAMGGNAAALVPDKSLRKLHPRLSTKPNFH
jgi:hypothetical protein